MLKRAPFLLGFIFVVLTVHRVAEFAGGSFNAWAMSIALAGGVFTSAYLTDFEKPKVRALVVLGFFLLSDGVFNLGATLLWSAGSGRWDYLLQLSNSLAVPIYRIADVLYGVFPTVGAALLAWLARKAEQTISRRRGKFSEAAKEAVFEWLFGKPAADLPAIAGILPEAPLNMTPVNGKLPEWLPYLPANRGDWRQMCNNGMVIPAGVTGNELGSLLGISERSARYYLEDYRSGHGTS